MKEFSVQNGYRTLVASEVHPRDGLGIELYRAGEKVAEVFRDDDRGGAQTVTIFGDRSIPIEVVTALIERAQVELGRSAP